MKMECTSTLKIGKEKIVPAYLKSWLNLIPEDSQITFDIVEASSGEYGGYSPSYLRGIVATWEDEF